MKMNLLVCAPLSHKAEIEKIFQYEKKTLGNFPGLGPYIGKLDQIRSTLQFGEKDHFVEQKPNHTVHQNNIEEYIKILFSLNVHFEIPKKNVFQFSWKGKAKNAFVTNPNFYYEIACMYYNYSVLYFNQGYQLLLAKDLKNTKEALKFFRIAMWGFEQVQKNVQSATTSGLLLPEFQKQELDLNFEVCRGMAYRAFYVIWKDKFKNENPEVEATLNASIANSLQKAIQLASSQQGFQFEKFDQLKGILQHYRVYHLVLNFLFNIGKHAQLHEQDCSLGHIGQQIAFITVLKKLKPAFKDALKFLQEPNAKELMEQVDTALSQEKDLVLKNDQVYKSEVPSEQKISLGPEFEN